MQTLIIPAAFVFLAAILLWITIGIKGRWWVKLLAMVITLLVSLQMWRSLDSYRGYFKTAELGSMKDKRAIREPFICGCDWKGEMKRSGGLRTPRLARYHKCLSFLIQGNFTKQ